MRSVGVRELKAHASQIVRDVRERRESVEVTHRGRVVARLVPAELAPSTADELADFWAGWDELAAEIAARWPKGVSATEAVSEQRREL